MTRQEQKEERRKAILMTGLKLFVERGYHETKIADIAAAVPMSTGLMFHYFASKEELLVEIIRMGAEGTKAADYVPGVPPDQFLTGFLRQLFSYAKEQPMVFYIFVLMGQARRGGMPEEAGEIANSVNVVGNTVELIRAGQEHGLFREGDPLTMSKCFWASVQGVMEEMAVDPLMQPPDPEWLVAILRK
uniref:TetR/AcrR family transcriptional regulator n=1 Tax=Eubacterium cellulosolvens TaxID=29322 RepID=UPI00047F23AD|nr:TetR/AcrR family transcriptional regulator [[Eubacterium] cellulosolvens]